MTKMTFAERVAAIDAMTPAELEARRVATDARRKAAEAAERAARRLPRDLDWSDVVRDGELAAEAAVQDITLGQLAIGDDLLAIGDNPAATITVGIAWTDEPQRLVVKSVWTDGKTMFASFENGGRLLPTSAKRTCTVAR